MTIRYDDQVAIVTGAGNGLGRSHAIQLAARGAKVVVNDLGGTVDGNGGGSAASEAVVAEIETAGGEAMAHGANVADLEQVHLVISRHGLVSRAVVVAAAFIFLIEKLGLEP